MTQFLLYPTTFKVTSSSSQFFSVRLMLCPFILRLSRFRRIQFSCRKPLVRLIGSAPRACDLCCVRSRKLVRLVPQLQRRASYPLFSSESFCFFFCIELLRVVDESQLNVSLFFGGDFLIMCCFSEICCGNRCDIAFEQ